MSVGGTISLPISEGDDSEEDNIVSGNSLTHSVSYSGISSAAKWLTKNIRDLKEELVDKIRHSRRRKL